MLKLSIKYQFKKSSGPQGHYLPLLTIKSWYIVCSY